MACIYSKSHFWTILCDQRPRQTKILLWGITFQELRGYIPEAKGKEQTSFNLFLSTVFFFFFFFYCMPIQFSSVVWVMLDSLRPHESQHARPPCPSPTPGVYSNSCPWVGDAIQTFHSLLSPSPPAPNPSQHRVFSNESTLSIKLLEFQLQHQSFQWTPRTELL